MFTGTAISGSDYTVISDITVPADSTGEYCANISIIDDNLFEHRQYTFTWTGNAAFTIHFIRVALLHTLTVN